MTTTIRVTGEHLAQGRMGDDEACPLALALRAHVPGEAAIHVRGDYAYVYVDPEHNGKSPLPREAQRFVYLYDTGEDVAPFEFELDLPDAIGEGPR